MAAYLFACNFVIRSNNQKAGHKFPISWRWESKMRVLFATLAAASCSRNTNTAACNTTTGGEWVSKSWNQSKFIIQIFLWRLQAFRVQSSQIFTLDRFCLCSCWLDKHPYSRSSCLFPESYPLCLLPIIIHGISLGFRIHR